MVITILFTIIVIDVIFIVDAMEVVVLIGASNSTSKSWPICCCKVLYL